MYRMYSTRKRQIEDDFARSLYRDLGTAATRKIRSRIREALRNAAMVGGVEERGRILGLLKDHPELRSLIEKDGVLKVLGYE